MSEALEVSVLGGKYTVVMDSEGRLSALRYGEPWRDCVGDGLILALADELSAARSDLARAQAELEKVRKDKERL